MLQALNPGHGFDKAGVAIVVPDLAEPKLAGKAARIEVDKTAQTLKAFDKQGKLLAFYPVTVGSAEKPAPSGPLKVTGVSRNPTYRYNPDYAFKGVKSKEPFTIKPGPNSPVGTVWIGLSAGLFLYRPAFFETDFGQFTSISSTSKISVAFGGMAPPAPCAP